jgi:3'-5' exoribonuclease
MFPEALMLHYLDDLDSKMEAVRAHFEREDGLESPWTSYNPSLGRPLLNSEKFLAPKKSAPQDSPPAAQNEPEPEAAELAAEDRTPTLPGLERNGNL